MLGLDAAGKTSTFHVSFTAARPRTADARRARNQDEVCAGAAAASGALTTPLDSSVQLFFTSSS